MTKQTKTTANEARFPLASLTLSDMNPRRNVSEQDIIELAGSIWAAGLIQNIAGWVDKKGMAEIVAGGRWTCRGIVPLLYPLSLSLPCLLIANVSSH